MNFSRTRFDTKKWLFAVACVPLACAHSYALQIGDATLALRPTAPPAKDPMVRGAHLVPQIPTDDRAYGIEPGGGVRSLESGVRLVNLPNGAVMSADEAFASRPAKVVEVPDRMGGGFLFLMGATVWRSDRWLGHARPLFASGESLNAIVVGLDRIYLESAKGAEQAIDPRTGAALDLGAWPPAPFVGAYAAMDGWRAVAAADLRGIVATFDAGASWHALPIPIEATEIKPYGGGLVVNGYDAMRQPASYEVRPDGQVARLATSPLTASPSNSSSPDITAKPFGDRPLLAAVEDGWPLADGTVVVARDGALARIRLDDGVIVELASNAYPLRPSRCHAIAYGDGAAFVCGETRGRTAIYRYENGAMIESRRFDSPRLVLASGSGAVAVRGPCDSAAPSDTGDLEEQSYCVIPKSAAASVDGSGAREVHLRGNIDGERVTVLAAGKLVVVSPPHGDLAAARVTVVDEKGQAQSKPLNFPSDTSREATRVLRNGLWLDGIEERRPGVLGAWVESSGTMLGVEIELDGHATAGAFIRDAGSAIVSGRFGLGWSASRRGYETIDGGMTWKPLEIPEPLHTPRSQAERACGPVGCVSSGWLRIGWGTRPPSPPGEPVQGPRTLYPPPKSLALSCEPTHPAPQLARTIALPAPSTQANTALQQQQLANALNVLNSPQRIAPQWANQQQQGYRTPIFTTLDWIPFFSAAAPQLRADDLGYSVDAGDATHLGTLMRFYAWGARGSEWEHTSRWIVRWLGPFSSASEVHSTQLTPPPQVVLDASHFANAFGVARPVSWTMVAGDDAQHALMIGHRQTPPDTVVLALEADHPPVEIRRSDGEPFDDIDAAIRMRGRWFLTDGSGAAPASSMTIWEADGGTAHEFVSLPRTLGEDRTQPVRLAARSDGRALGVIVEGEPLAARPNTPIRWALSIDADDATVGALEPLGAVDFADRNEISICTGDEAGWIFDVAWPTSTITAAVRGTNRPLRNAYARVRATATALCIERLAGLYDAPPDALARPRGNLPHAEAQSIELAAVAAHLRYGLRCVRTP